MFRIPTASIRIQFGMAAAVGTLLLIVFTSRHAQGAFQNKGGEAAPVFNEYRGVAIGMTADDVRKKLGNPKDKGATDDTFVFNDKEQLQIVYDAAHKVVTVSADFQSGASGVPAAKAVLGSELEAKADGSMYRMVRYPKAGYWVSFSRTAGDTPLISIMIQKIE
jgi:hypothetical protein